ncbi:hypothetical protein B7463_g12425, partial [Scytalidium lignicola]
METPVPRTCPAILEIVVEALALVQQKAIPNRQQYITRFGRVATKIGLQRINNIGDTYEPGIARERGYQVGISSIYHTDSIEETAVLANLAIQSGKSVEAVEIEEEESQETQDCIEVMT